MHDASLPVGDRDWMDEKSWWGTENDVVAKQTAQFIKETQPGERFVRLEKLTTDEMRRVCIRLGLDYTGDRSGLYTRLQSYDAQTPPCPKVPPELLIEAKIIGQKSIWKNADMHGWHNPPATLPEDLLLIHSEISEACEGFRQGKIHMCKPDGTVEFNGSVEEELADAVIRIFHVAEKNGLDICRAVFIKHQRNISRPFRHGNKVI